MLSHSERIAINRLKSIVGELIVICKNGPMLLLDVTSINAKAKADVIITAGKIKPQESWILVKVLWEDKIQIIQSRSSSVKRFIPHSGPAPSSKELSKDE